MHKNTPSCRSPFLFSCMACSKLLWRILLRVPIHSSISASLSAASRNVLLSCIFSSKAKRRTLLFWKNTNAKVDYIPALKRPIFYMHTFIFPSPEQPPCMSQGRWFLWDPWRCSRPCRSWGCRIHLQAGPDGSTSSWRTRGWKQRTLTSPLFPLKIPQGWRWGVGKLKGEITKCDKIWATVSHLDSTCAREKKTNWSGENPKFVFT